MRVIAIDGPGGSGKSTVARALALRLGLPRLDTGAMYRAVALLALRNGVDTGDESTLAALAREMDLTVGESVLLDGEDISQAIRTPEIDAAVSYVARQPRVREELVARQRAWAQLHGGGVVEGRDITTVVFPDADLKVFLTASEGERARRRAGERNVGDGSESDVIAATRRAIARRDELDSSRTISPLTRSEEAVEIDSTGLSVEAVIDLIVGLL
jgi:cytidylate kinase